jgi:hypothetical protein
MNIAEHLIDAYLKESGVDPATLKGKIVTGTGVQKKYPKGKRYILSGKTRTINSMYGPQHLLAPEEYPTREEWVYCNFDTKAAAFEFVD